MVFLDFVASGSANQIGMNVIARPVTRERIASLPRKEQKAWLEYLDRSERQKVIDKRRLADEQKAANNTNPKHAPLGFGGRGMRADHPAEWWSSDEAIKAARNLVSWQVADGGWSKNIDMVSQARAPAICTTPTTKIDFRIRLTLTSRSMRVGITLQRSITIRHGCRSVFWRA